MSLIMLLNPTTASKTCRQAMALLRDSPSALTSFLLGVHFVTTTTIALGR